jgi:hypothetical protein
MARDPLHGISEAIPCVWVQLDIGRGRGYVAELDNRPAPQASHRHEGPSAHSFLAFKRNPPVWLLRLQLLTFGHYLEYDRPSRPGIGSDKGNRWLSFWL